MALGTAGPDRSDRTSRDAAEASFARPKRVFARIPEAFISELNAKADILEIVSRSVKLKKTGQNYVGLCPFHGEKTPSFTVAPHKGFYHCFGCGAAGNALSFLMEYEGTAFRDAIEELCTSTGTPLPAEMTRNEASAPAIDTTPLFSAMERASRFFSHCLRHSNEAKSYLKGRGLTADSLKRYLIGYAPDEWRSLKEAFPDYDKNPFIQLTGLIRENDSNKKYDTFRNRITFGVRDTRGRIVAFGGRIIGDGEPKYLNSPESPIFNKSGALFGLFEARESIRQKRLALVVEGYMDVVMLAQCGVHNVVASMGTAFTRWHMEKLLTQTDCVVFAFDGDKAGRQAARRALESVVGMVEDHHDIRFLLLPDGKDPDELVQEEGAEAFEARIQAAPSLSQFLIAALSEGNNGLATAEDRARFASEGAILAGKISYRTKLRSQMLQLIASESRMPGSALRALQPATHLRSAPHAFWSKLAGAARLCPGLAQELRGQLLPLLDLDDPDETAFAQSLEAPQAQAQAEAQNTGSKQDGHPGGHPESGVMASPEALLARDTLSHALDLIVEYRERQHMLALREQFNKGEITEDEYLDQTLPRDN
jgi:DNA primase